MLGISTSIFVGSSPRRRWTSGISRPEPILSFQITDTGVGFTDTNYESFETSDSMYKASQGGKGIGRLLWLKAFDGAEVSSTYQEKDKWRKRTFRFTIDGIKDHHVTDLQDGDPLTSVRLYGFHATYRDRSPQGSNEHREKNHRALS